jgi:hypothetical protein
LKVEECSANERLEVATEVSHGMYFSIDYVLHPRYIDSQPRSWRGASRRSTHPAIWDERSKKCKPGEQKRAAGMKKTGCLTS